MDVDGAETDSAIIGWGYCAVDRMERKGYVSSVIGERSQEIYANLWNGLELDPEASRR